MTEAAALLTATRDATRVIGFGADAGTLEPGRFADLLVLRADPLRDIRVITDDTAREAVVQGGRVVSWALTGRRIDRPSRVSYLRRSVRPRPARHLAALADALTEGSVAARLQGRP